MHTYVADGQAQSNTYIYGTNGECISSVLIVFGKKSNKGETCQRNTWTELNGFEMVYLRFEWKWTNTRNKTEGFFVWNGMNARPYARSMWDSPVSLHLLSISLGEKPVAVFSNSIPFVMLGICQQNGCWDLLCHVIHYIFLCFVREIITLYTW